MADNRFPVIDMEATDANITRHRKEGGTDYPYLTYNDLYDLQALLKERTGQTDPTLSAIMEAKKKWMDENGVTGYKQ